MKIGIVTNYNLDSAISSLFLDIHFASDEIIFKCGGYGKVQQNIIAVKQSGAEKLIVVGFPLTNKLIQYVQGFKEVMFFDSNTDTKNKADDKNVHHHPLGACMAVSKWILKNDSSSKISNKRYVTLAVATTSYINMMNNNKYFNLGYKLNVLFYKMGMWNFKSEFAYGLPDNNKFSANINTILKDYFNRRNKVLFSSKPFLIGDNSALYSDNEFIDDYAICIPGYHIYYTIRNDFVLENHKTISIRVAPSLKNKYNLNKFLDEFYATNSKAQSYIFRQYGNASAYGITFIEGLNLPEIISFIEELNAFVEEKRLT